MPISGEYVSLAQAARELGVVHSAIHMAIAAGRLQTEDIAGRRVIAREEVDRYKVERADRGWDKRRAGQPPSAAALRMRASRARRKQEQETATRAEGDESDGAQPQEGQPQEGQPQDDGD